MKEKRPEYLEEDSIFVRHIESDRNICSNCYRKLREHHETMHEIATPITEYEDDVDFAYFDDFVDSGRPNIEKAYCLCGTADWNDVRLRPLSQSQMEEFGMRIVNRLIEKGYVVDEEKFFEVIDEKGPLPSNQCREEKVFQSAISQSVSKLDSDESTDSSNDGAILV